MALWVIANAQGKTMVAVTSGANMNFDRLRLVTELADLGANVLLSLCKSCLLPLLHTIRSKCNAPVQEWNADVQPDGACQHC